MTKEQIRFEKFIKAEQKYIDDAKYYEGINTNSDPGINYIYQWISKYAKEFRQKWDVSICKDCFKADKCGDKLKFNCDSFENYPES